MGGGHISDSTAARDKRHKRIKNMPLGAAGVGGTSKETEPATDSVDGESRQHRFGPLGGNDGGVEAGPLGGNLGGVEAGGTRVVGQVQGILLSGD